MDFICFLSTYILSGYVVYSIQEKTDKLLGIILFWPFLLVWWTLEKTGKLFRGD